MIRLNGDAASRPVPDATGNEVRCVIALSCAAYVAFRMCDCVQAQKESVVVFVKAACVTKPGAQYMLISML